MRRLVAATAAAALALTGLLAIATPSQAALEGPVAFGAGDLPTWQANNEVWTVAGAQGLAFVGGTFSSIRPPGAEAGVNEVPRANFAVFDAATGNPTSCAPAFTFPTDPSLATVRSLNVSPDQQTLYIGGYFSNAGGVSRQFLAAMNIATCTIVPGFVPLPGGAVRAIVSTPTTVYYAGQFTAVGSTPRARAAATPAVGQPGQGSLLPWAPSFDGEVRAITIKPDHSLVVLGGDFLTVNGTASSALAVVNATDGATVKTYPTSFIPTNSKVKDLAADETGFYTGNEGSGGGVFDGRLAMDWSTLEQRWRDTCLGATQAVLPYQGVLYSGHHAHDCSSMGSFADGQRYHFTAQSTQNAQPFLAWTPDSNDGINEFIGPRDLAVAPSPSGDYLWAVGMFTTVNGNPQQSITRFPSGVENAVPSAATMHLSSFKPGEVRVAWRSAVDWGNISLTYRVYRDNVLVHTATGDSYRWDRPQMSFTDTGRTPGANHAYRITVDDGTRVTQGASRNITVAGGSSPYAQQVLQDNPSVYLRHDELGDVFMADSKGDYGLYKQGGGTFQVTPPAIANDPSTALSLVEGAWLYGNNQIPSPSTFSIETWFKTTTTRGGKLVGFGNKQTLRSSSYDKHIYMQNDGAIRFGVYSGSTITLVSPPGLNDGEWHHVVASQGPSGMALYIDGNRVAQNGTTVNQSYAGFWRVGGDNLSSWPSRPTSDFFEGTFDETAIYDKALTPAQVTTHFLAAGGTLVRPGPTDFYGQSVYEDQPTSYWRLGESGGTDAADASGNGRPGIYSGGVTFGETGSVAGTTNTSVRLNGTDGRVRESAQQSAPGIYSTETWIRTTTTTGGRIVGFGNSNTGTSGTSTRDRHVYMRNDGRLVFGIRPTSGTQSTVVSPLAYNDGQDHHVVATRSATAISLYVDGELVGSTNVSGNYTYTGRWRWGGDSLSGWPSAPSSSHFNGWIDEASIYPVALSAAQIQAHFSAGSATAADTAPPTRPFGVMAGITGGNPALTWQESQDNVGVTGYDIHRSATPGFTPTSGTKVATTASTSFTDPSAPTGDLYYVVVANDAAGNSSKASAEVGLVLTDTQAPTSPSGVVASSGATSISLSWTASSDNVGVTSYDVHRSSSAAFTPSAGTLLATVSTTDYLDSPVAPGSWYYRVVARDAAGNASAPSAAAMGAIADEVAPTEPANLQASVTGTTIDLSWSASTDNVGVTGYRVHRGAAADFVPSAGTLVGSPSGTSYSDGSVPAGTWFYRVLAVDGTGNSSTPSASVQVTVAAATSVVSLTPTADAFANAGAVTANYGSDASLASRGNPAATSYLRFQLPSAPAGTVLTSAVLSVRTNTLTSAGSVEPHQVAIASNAWSEGTLTWVNRPAVTGPEVGAISTALQPNTVYDTPLDAAALQGLLGTDTSLAVSNLGTDILWFWSRNHAAPSYRPQLILTFSASSPDTQAPSSPSGLDANVTGATVDLGWNASSDDVGVTGYDVHRSSTSGFTPTPGTLVGTTTGTTAIDSPPAPGTWYYRVVAKDAAGNLSTPSAQASAVIAAPDTTPPTVPTGLDATVDGADVDLTWNASSDAVGVTGYEVHRSTTSGFTPTAGTLIASPTATTYTDNGPGLGTWYYRVIAKDAADNKSDASAQDSATVVPTGDTTPPSAPTGLSADVDGTSVTVSWSASSDDTGVTGYDVYRGPSSGFSPSASTLVGSTASTSFTNTSVPAGTWFFKVVAEDAADNRSQASAAVSANVLEPVNPPPPVVTTVTPIADTYAVSSAPTTNYGTSASLAAGSVGANSYLRFDLPAAPAGMQLSGATLRVRTTSISTAGSTSEHAITLGSNAWDESTLTWNNRPSPAGPSLGSIVGATAVSSEYTFPLATAPLAGALGSAATVAVASSSTDSLWFWSSNHPAAAYRPALQLTFTGTGGETQPLAAEVMAVGDIACAPGTPVTATTCRHADVAAAINDEAPFRFLALGDMQYESATLAEFTGAGSYNSAFGSLKPFTLPIVGNHENLDPSGATNGYFDYFYGAGVNTGPLGDRGKGYYASSIGTWKYIALNSECAPDGPNGNTMVAGGCDVGSPQYTWLQNELATSPQCTIVAFHRPRWTTSASHAPYDPMAPMWDLMAANGVDVTVSGHAHSTEMFKPIGVSGAGTPTLDADGIRSFVAGAGGANLRAFNAPSGAVFDALDARDNTTFGALKLTLSPGSFAWDASPIAGQNFTHAGTSGAFSGSSSCH